MKLRIDPDKCVRCLECYDSCPVCAINIDWKKPRIVDGCKDCGVCKVICPQRAIERV